MGVPEGVAETPVDATITAAHQLVTTKLKARAGGVRLVYASRG
jgi:hypothetical protein